MKNGKTEVFPFFFINFTPIFPIMFFKRKIFRFIASLLAFLPFVGIAQTTEHQWQEAKVINGNFKAISNQPDIEVFSAPHVIMIKVNHDIDVRIFTILGKLVSQQHLTPGIYEYKMDSHGIYIIKTEESSCKIAI